MEADRRLLGRVEVLSCGEKVKNKKGAHKPKYDALRVTTTGCETLDGRKDVNAYKKKSPKKSGDVVGDERHRRALSLLCTAVGEGFGGLVEPGFGGDNVTWRGVGGENSLSLAVGMRLSIGGVRCVVTQFNEPCSNLKPLWRRLAAAEARWPGWPRETTRLTHGITACNGPLGQIPGPGSAAGSPASSRRARSGSATRSSRRPRTGRPRRSRGRSRPTSSRVSSEHVHL